MAKILVVDDNKNITDVNAELLKMDGHEVLVANSKATALEIMRQHKDINLLLTDCEMGDQFAGIELIAEARKAGFSGPAILYTGDVLNQESIKRRLHAIQGTNIFSIKGSRSPDELVAEALSQQETSLGGP